MEEMASSNLEKVPSGRDIGLHGPALGDDPGKNAEGPCSPCVPLGSSSELTNGAQTWNPPCHLLKEGGA